MKVKPKTHRLLMLLTVAAAIGVGGMSSHAADLAGAQKSFQGFCAACHGISGKGDGPAGASLPVKPMDFDDCSAMTKVSDTTMFTAIKSGGRAVGKSPEMPAAGAAFNDTQIHDLVAYVRSFCKK